MAKKKTKTRKKKKRHQDKYNVKFIERVELLVLKSGMINRRSEIAWTKVAYCLAVTPVTIRRWLDPDHKLYKKDFAAAVELIQEEIDAGRVKHGTLIAATKHTLHRRNWELQDDGPMKPRQSWPITVLRKYAEEQLGIRIPAGLRKAAVEYTIKKAIEAQTKRKKKYTSGSVQEVDANPDARRLILKNLGKSEDRWNLKDEIEGGAIATINIEYTELAEDPNKGKTIDGPQDNSDNATDGQPDDSKG